MQDVEQKWWKPVIAPLIVSMFVGAFVGYMTVRVLLTEHTERIDTNKQRIVRLEDSRKKDAEISSDLRERMIRVETKLDLLIRGQIKDRETEHGTD